MFIILSPSMSRTHYSLPFSLCPELRIPFSLTPREPKRNMFLIGLSSLWFFLCLKNTPTDTSFVMYHYSLHLCLFKRLFSPCPLKTLSRHLCNGPLFSPYLSFKNAILSMSFRNAVKIPDPVIIGSKTLQYCWSFIFICEPHNQKLILLHEERKEPDTSSGLIPCMYALCNSHSYFLQIPLSGGLVMVKNVASKKRSNSARKLDESFFFLCIAFEIPAWSFGSNHTARNVRFGKFLYLYSILKCF